MTDRRLLLANFIVDNMVPGSEARGIGPAFPIAGNPEHILVVDKEMGVRGAAPSSEI